MSLINILSALHLWCFTLVFLHAQPGDKIILQQSFDGVPFQEFAGKVSESYPITFFFKGEWVDSLLIKQNSVPANLEDILTTTFADRNLFFFFDSTNILISRDAPISSFKFENIFDENYTLTYLDKYEKDAPPEEQYNDAQQQSYIILGENTNTNGEASISGFIKEEETGEPLIGAVVYAEDASQGVVSDVSGYYHIALSKGQHQVTYQSLGKKAVKKQILLNGDGIINLELSDEITALRGVEIVAEKYQNVAGIQMGMERVDIKSIKNIPTSMGETDIIKSALLLPGVQTVGESASGFNVRGGSTDQNLILFDGAPIYNSSHLFGFFSAINSEIIRDFELYKSGIPAEFGGRISSVFDISSRDGNKKRFSGSGGLSPITGRIAVEGPIVKDKASFLISGRSTYSDWLLRQLNDPAIRNSDASFYDVNAKISIDFDTRNRLEISGYRSNDYFRLNSDTAYTYQNQTLSASYMHRFSDKLVGYLKGIYSSYDYTIRSNQEPATAFNMNYAIEHRELQSNFSYFLTANHKVLFGASSILYGMNPGEMKPAHSESLIAENKLEHEQASESAAYLGNEFTLGKKLKIYAGLRYSHYMLFGPAKVYQYAEGVPREAENISDTTLYEKNEIIKSYGGPEIRFSARYKLGSKSSVKISYNRMRQYLHMLSNTTAISPTDAWKLSDTYIPPQIGDQYTIGLYRDILNRRIESSIEVYYKEIKDVLEYEGGAQLLLNRTIESDLIKANGEAYGVEILLKKPQGRLNGWISYTYSKVFVQTFSDFPSEQINNGELYPANFDKPHDVSVVANFKFTRRLSASGNFVYSTGRPITYPIAKYSFRNATLLHYSDRNEFRIPDYMRVDFSVTLDGNLRADKIWHSSWSFSVYNLTGRDNVYSIFFTSKNGQVNGYKMSIFAQPIVTLTYNFKF